MVEHERHTPPASTAPAVTPPVPMPVMRSAPVAPKPPRKYKGLVIFAAWVSVFIFGVLLSALALFLSNAIIGSYKEEIDAARLFLIMAMIGLLVLAISIVALWRSKKRTYARHVLIGLWIGVVLFSLMLTVGGLAFVVLDLERNSSDSTVSVCTTPLQQLNRSADAVIPIQTDLGFGTGFSVDDKGTVLTAYHVIEGAQEIYANYVDGRSDINVLATSPEDDLALLRMSRPTETYLQLSDQYQAGDPVLSYGYPGNAINAGPPSISTGVVSRVLTTEDLRSTDASFPDGFEMVQTDAAINPGNSGGPLIGSCGVVGIINSISDASELSDYVGVVSEQGIGYAVSTKTAAQRFQLPLAVE